MNLKENLPSRPATDAPGFAGSGTTATPRFGFGRAFAWLLLAFALLAPAAQAATITRTFSFAATGFASGPETRVTGSFTVTFDPAVSVTDQAAGITVNSLSIPYGSPVVFTYFTSNGWLIIGAGDSATMLASGVNDFVLVVQKAATVPYYYQFGYTSSHTMAGFQASTLTPGDIVSGGWVNGANFTIGGVGTANDVNNWPAAESPWQAADGNAATKFLLFKGSNAGLIITPPSSATYNRLALTTANDGPERDPASYIIYGSATALPTSGNIPISSLTVIASGTLALTDVRNNGTTVAGPAIVQFNNTTAYASYVVVFPTVKSSPNLTQIAEVKLSQGLTVPNQVAVGKAVGGKLVGGSWSNGSIRQSGNPEGNNWPAGQSPDHALDGDATTKYLHFQGPNASLGIRPETSPAVINSVSFWTANDEAARDPFGYEVWGNNSGLNPFVGSVPTSSWILLKSGNLTLPPDRNFGPVTVNFPNTTAYAYYAVVFPTVKDSPSVLLTQISEVAFANVALNVAPTDIALSNATLPENNAANATIGTLTATDADAGQTHAFALVAGTGSTDNAAFTITGNTLKINASADFETKASYAIRIRATDSGAGNLTFEKNFTVTITDVTIPQTITFGALANKTFGDAAFTVSATGGASGQPVTFSLINTHPAWATISGSTVTINGASTVTVRASQAGAGDYGAATPVDRSFTVAKAPQTITFNLATTALTTDTVTLTASGGGSGLPVSFSVFSGPGSIAGNALTFTGPGAVVVRASQAGSNSGPGDNYLAATPVDRTITASVPVTAPVITTPTSASVLASTATLGGNVTSNGGSPITERGVVYSLTSANADPLISGSGVTKVTTNGTSGIFTVPVTGLTAVSGYSFKAYAINGIGTTYTSVATFTTAIGSTIVTTTADSGTGSLRQAVLNANANPGADAITFDPTVFATAQTVVLASGLPTFTGNTTVTGPAAGVTVQGASGATSFVIGAAANVNLTGLTFSNGITAVDNRGTLTVSECVFSASTDQGIYNDDTGTLVVNNSTIRSGTVIANHGIATMTGCTVITGNSEAAINNAVGGSLTLINCTALDANGTYLFNNQDSGSTVTAIHCTLIETAASYNDGGTTLTLKNSIYRRNPASSAFTDGGGNLVISSTGADAAALTADLTALGLDPTGLQSNGGPTLTIKLLGGPAINGGVNANVPGGLTTDQRGSGFPRSVGSVDIGAYEAPANSAPTDTTLSNATLAENNAANATVGALTATDADAGDTHTFTLVAGAGDMDNAAFTITGNALKINTAADFEAKSSYAIRVRATDSGAGNLTFEKPFIITVTDVNEAPVGGMDGIARLDNTRSARVAKSVLLANDSDPDGDTLTATASISNVLPAGSLISDSLSFITYVAPSNTAGDGSFDYTLSDGHGHTVTVHVTVTQVVVPPPAQAPNAASITLVGSDVVLSYIGVPGNQYRVQYTTSAGPAYVWQEFNPLAVYTAPASGVFTHTDVNPTGPVRLYRAIPHP